MLSLKPRLRNALLLFLSGICSSCASNPPDTLGCASYPAADWFAYQQMFNKLCAEDPACSPNLSTWKSKVSTWTLPSDSGTCVTWITRHVYDVDATHPLPAAVTGTGKDQAWTDLAVTGVLLPAKASVAPLETYIQSECHANSQCGAVGNWQGTVQATNQTLSTQSAKVETVQASKGTVK